MWLFLNDICVRVQNKKTCWSRQSPDSPCENADNATNFSGYLMPALVDCRSSHKLSVSILGTHQNPAGVAGRNSGFTRDYAENMATFTLN